jgi:hypothetical protein
MPTLQLLDISTDRYVRPRTAGVERLVFCKAVGKKPCRMQGCVHPFAYSADVLPLAEQIVTSDGLHMESRTILSELRLWVLAIVPIDKSGLLRDTRLTRSTVLLGSELSIFVL